MALSLSNNFEGGTSGTTVSTSNSGGTSGNAFDVVSIGTGCALTFDGTNPAHGAGLGMQLVEAATAAASYVGWSTSLGTLSTNQTLGGRIYLAIGALPTGGMTFFQAIFTSTVLCGIKVGATGKIVPILSAGVAGTSGTATLSTNTLYRVEWQFTGVGGGTTAGAYTVTLFAGDSTTALDTITASAVNLGASAPDTVRFGMNNAGGASTSFWYDALNINDVGAPGPETTGPASLARTAADTSVTSDAAVKSGLARQAADTSLSSDGAVISVVASQISRPSADIVTTGWSTAPLWSKINDQSDATVITSTI